MIYPDSKQKPIVPHLTHYAEMVPLSHENHVKWLSSKNDDLVKSHQMDGKVKSSRCKARKT